MSQPKVYALYLWAIYMLWHLAPVTHSHIIFREQIPSMILRGEAMRVCASDGIVLSCGAIQSAKLCLPFSCGGSWLGLSQLNNISQHGWRTHRLASQSFWVGKFHFIGKTFLNRFYCWFSWQFSEVALKFWFWTQKLFGSITAWYLKWRSTFYLFKIYFWFHIDIFKSFSRCCS